MMKVLTVAMIALALFAESAMSFAATPASLSEGRAEDETAISKIVYRLRDGWNAGDGRAFAAPFAEDADYVIVNGVRIKGRGAIEAGHQQIFDTIYKNSRISATVESVRFLCDNVAIAHVQWQLKYRENNTERDSKAMNSLVLKKENRQWVITAFHNTPVASANR
jgi:uncharacterized protein (TIGR02246 family)